MKVTTKLRKPFEQSSAHSKASKKNFAIKLICSWQAQVRFIAPYVQPALMQRIATLLGTLEQQIRAADISTETKGENHDRL